MPHAAFINNVFTEKITQAFCWMLIHSLWQGLFFTIISGIVMMCTRKSSAALRYNILSALFFSFIAICTSTFIWQFNNAGAQVSQQGINETGIFNGSNIQILIKSFTGYFSANASLIMMVWFMVFLAKCVKMMAGFAYMQRIKHYKTQPASASWKNKIESLCDQLQVKRRVSLLESGIIKIPVVIGHLKPIILIPIGLLTNMPDGEVEAVLLHELAHIRRNDYFVNMIQAIAENIFFFNPALLWMSALLREERENCCDDIAVAHTKNKKQFIQALISFKEHALQTTTKYAVAFPAKKNQLLHRVARIINSRNKTLNASEKIFFLASFLLLLILFVTAANSNVLSATQKQGQTNTKEQKQKADADAPADTLITIDDVKRYVINDKSIAGKDELVAGQNISYAKVDAAKHKSQSFEYYRKTITIGNDETVDKKQQEVNEPDVQLAAQQRQEDLDMLEAQKDMEQANEDAKQAALDQIQSKKDQQQALIDMKQAERDRKRSLQDQQVALKLKINSIPAKN